MTLASCSAPHRSGSCEAKGCLFCCCNVIIYFIVETQSSALTGRILSFLCYLIWFHCDFFPFRHLTDLPPKFHKGLTAKFGAAFVNPRPDWTATIPKRCNFLKPQHKLVLHRWLCYHVLKLGEDWSPHFCNPSRCFCPENGRNRKMGDSEVYNFKTAEDKAILSVSGKQPEVSSFYVPNFTIIHLGVSPK